MVSHGQHLLCSLSFIIVMLSFIQTHRIEIPRETNHDFALIIGKMFKSEEMGQCTIQIFLIEDELSKTHANLPDAWWKLFTNSLYTPFLKERSAIVISKTETNLSALSNNQTKRYKKPERHRHASSCSVVIIVINVSTFTLDTETALKTELVSPTLRPSTIRNRDKYLILTPKNAVDELHKSKLVRELKYKLFFVLINSVANHTFWKDVQLNVKIKMLCQYGLCRKQTFVNVKSQLLTPTKYSSSVIKSLFPDHEKNFFGHTLRLSTTTRVPQLLELEIFTDENGNEIVHPKRGLYASVLAELSKRLNFTSKIVPSSGSGSTGHALPNGTWVGTVGDTFSGRVDFGFMAAITFQRFPYAELCAPINFAYLGFVTGPPRKTFAWNAIVRPFNPLMWACLAITILVAGKLLTELSSPFVFARDENLIPVLQKRVKWSYLKALVILVRELLEQSAEIPKNKDEISFRTFLTFWLTYCLVCSTVYRSKMVSLLTFPSYDHIPSTFDELATAKGFVIDFHYFGNVGYAYFKTSTNPSFMKIYKKMGREPNPLKCLQRTIDEKAACIIFIVTYEELLHRNLSDQYGKSPLKFTRHEGAMFPAGVIHQYKAPLSVNFQFLLFSAMETGIIPFWQQTDLNQVLKEKNLWQKANKIDINAAIWGNVMEDNLLRVRNLKGAFGMLALGIIIAILFFGAEKNKFWDKVLMWRNKSSSTNVSM